MTFSTATPKPFPGTRKGEENLIPQSQETGQVVPEGHDANAATVTKEKPVAKPWAHFVAGGYYKPSKRSLPGKSRLTGF